MHSAAVFPCLLLASELCVLLALGKRPAPFFLRNDQDNTPPHERRPPRCGEGYSYFAPFMKCDASLGYCFHYDRKDCVGPPNWSCVHALNNGKGTVTGQRKKPGVKNSGLGNSRCCGGRLQSPIDIAVDQVRCLTRMTPPVYYQPAKLLRGFFENNGGFAEFRVNTFNYDNPLLLLNVPYTCAVPGSSVYVLTSVRVHVGREGRRSSEHSVQGKFYDAELHLVHVRRDFWKPSKAGHHPSKVNLHCASQTPMGITTVAIFLSISEGELNKELDQFLSTYNLRVNQHSKKICPFEDFCRVPRRKLSAHDPNDAILNSNYCPEQSPEQEAQSILLSLQKKKAKGDKRGKKDQTVVVLAGDPLARYKSLRKMMKKMRKKQRQKQQKAEAYLRSRGRRRKRQGMSRRKRVRCFCRRRRYLEKFLWLAGIGNEMTCRKVHNYGMPDVSSENNAEKSGPASEDVFPRSFKMRPGLLLPDDPGFYQYFGSMTTPPCSEVVNWIVMKQPLKITRDQLAALRQLHSSEAGIPVGVVGNVRPTRPLNDRVVVTNGPC